MKTQVAPIQKVNRRGFTLVELVVVVVIMGIIAAVALPKMATNSKTAKENAAKQSLTVIRDAIELYKAEKDGFPSDAATLATDLKPYLKGPFPESKLIDEPNATIATATEANPTVVSGGAGWAYNPTTGDFYINHADYVNY